MNIEYKDIKDLPNEELYQLFLAVGWADEKKTTLKQIHNFNVGFIHSTFVFSAWCEGKLIGCVRVLSDLYFRSIIYDLAVLSAKRNWKRISTKMYKNLSEFRMVSSNHSSTRIL